jgi:transcription elongation factor Elf1
MHDLVHNRIPRACPHCGGKLIVSTWFDSHHWFIVTTCNVCDAPSPTNAFPDETPGEWRF